MAILAHKIDKHATYQKYEIESCYSERKIDQICYSSKVRNSNSVAILSIKMFKYATHQKYEIERFILSVKLIKYVNHQSPNLSVSIVSIKLIDMSLIKSKKYSKHQESIQTSTTPVPGYQMVTKSQ